MIAILSDVHGNLPALEAVLRDAYMYGCTRFISLGDVVGYYAQPGECIDHLQRCGAINILGNHDFYLISDTNCPRSKVVAGIIDYQRKQVTKGQVDWLKGSVRSHSEGTYCFVHGGPHDPLDEYLYEVSYNTIPTHADYLFSGHTHVQILAEFGKKKYCNPGAVGQPRDGDWRAAYAILNGDKIILRRVDYNIERTVLAMQNAGFESFCYGNLYKGSQIGGRIDTIRIKQDEE